MEVIFESTEHFEKELAQFQSREQATIISKINLYCGSYPRKHIKGVKSQQSTKLCKMSRHDPYVCA